MLCFVRFDADTPMPPPRNDIANVSRRMILRGLCAGASSAVLPAGLAWPGAASADTPVEDGLGRGLPADAGVDSRAVLDFIDRVFAHDLDLHSVMVYRHGMVVAEAWSWPYASRRPHMMHSLTKSVTACGVGAAIDEGYFGPDDAVVSFFEDELPPVVDDKLAAMTVRDLLTMQSGHAESVSGSVFRQVGTSWIAEFFKVPVVYQPGTHFLYSSAVSFMLSAIVSRTTGESLRDFLQPRMFEPLGISGIRWGASPNGISSGGNGLTWQTADSLKLGILHLQMGAWGDRRVLPRGWVESATRAQVPAGNYGYQWWVNDAAKAYYAAGAFGQYAIVFPRHDAVVAITAGVQRSSSVLDIAWDYFPEAFGAGRTEAGAAADAALRERTEHLRLLPEARSTSSPVVDAVSGQTYVMEANADGVSTVELSFVDDRLEFRLADHRGEHLVVAGLADWIEGSTSITGNKLHHQYQSDDMKVVAHARWFDDRTLEMTWQFVETAWVDHVVCRFAGGRISIDRRTNANYAPRVAPTLRGTARKV